MVTRGRQALDRQRGTIADLVVAWARDTQDGQVKSFMVETPARGYEASVTTGKVSLQ